MRGRLALGFGGAAADLPMLATKLRITNDLVSFGGGLEQSIGGPALGATVWDLAFLPDRSLAIATAGGLCRWDHAASRVLWRLAGAHHQLAVSPDGRYICSDDHSRVEVLDAATGKTQWRIVPEGEVECLAISPDSRTLAIGVKSPSQMELWDLISGRQLISMPLPSQLVLRKVFFARDGARLLADGYFENEPSGQIFEWSIRTSTGAVSK